MHLKLAKVVAPKFQFSDQSVRREGLVILRLATARQRARLPSNTRVSMGADESKPADAGEQAPAAAPAKEYAWRPVAPPVADISDPSGSVGGKKHVSLAVVDDSHDRGGGGDERVSVRQSRATGAADTTPDAAAEWMRRSAALDKAYAQKKQDEKKSGKSRKAFGLFGKKGTATPRKAGGMFSKRKAEDAVAKAPAATTALPPLDPATAKDVEQILHLMMEYGRRYEEGEVLITFAEMQDHYFEAMHDGDAPVEWSAGLSDLLLVAAQRKRLNYHTEREHSRMSSVKNAHDEETHVLLAEGVDEEVVITAPDDHTCDETMKVKVWRAKMGDLKPVWGSAAPLVDLDDGELRYVAIQCVAVSGELMTLVRGYSDITCKSFGDVLEEAVPPLALAGYVEIKPLGGGLMTHSKAGKTTNLHGSSPGFGAADHQAAAKILQIALGADHTCTFNAP